MVRHANPGGKDPIAGLFALPLHQFTAGRRALVAELRRQGRAADAAAVLAINKPPASAWAVNQLHWHQPSLIRAVITSGARLRAAQQARGTGAGTDLRGALGAWRTALATATARAAALLSDGGHTATPFLLRRISTTLEALAALAESATPPRIGQLTRDLTPPAFEPLAALVPRTAAPVGRSRPGGGQGHEQRVIPFDARTREAQAPVPPRRTPSPAAVRAAGKRDLERAKKKLLLAKKAARAAERHLRTAAGKARLAAADQADAAEAQAQAEARLARATAAADAATATARRLARTAEAAAEAVSDAERDLELARARLRT